MPGLSFDLFGLGAADEERLDVDGVVPPVTAQTDPNRAQVAGLFPTPDGRDVDPEQACDLANAE